MRVSKKISWHMAHRLFRYEGLCGDLHGHTYSAELVLSGEPDLDTGLLVDFTDMKKNMSELIDNYFDHSTLLYAGDPLRESLGCYSNRLVLLNKNTTAENIAQVLFNEWKRTFSELIQDVKVYETPSSVATVSCEDLQTHIVFKTNCGENYCGDFPIDRGWKSYKI